MSTPALLECRRGKVLAGLPSCDVAHIECLVEGDGMDLNQTAGLAGQRQDVVVAHPCGIEESEGQIA